MASKRQHSSDVWNSFTPSEDGNYAICNQCNSKLKCVNYGTSSLKYHLKKHEKENLKCQKVSNTPDKKEKTEEALYAELVAFDNIPMSVCAKSQFIRESMEMRGMKSYTSPTTIAEKVMKYHSIVKEEIKEKLKLKLAENNRISLTTDEYTGKNNKRFMNINVHYNDGDFDSLGMVRVWGSQKSETLLKLIEIRLKEFDLTWKNVVGCTTDGASVMV